MKTIKVYIYPIPSVQQKDKESNNYYIRNFCASIESSFNVINSLYPSKFESLDLIRYFSAKIFFYNWIEDLPNYKYGKLRVLLFIPALLLIKICNKKIIWTLHNKKGHMGNSIFRDFMEFFMVRISDKIITHAKEGITFFCNKYPKYISKMTYLCHPIVPIKDIIKIEKQIKFDFLIWGSITPYKGIIDFLKYLKSHDLNYKVCIIGKCSEDEYEEEMNSYLFPGITYINKFYSIEKIALFANQSKFILFTYQVDSVLSSGSLMDSISMRTPVLGPRVGAFIDMEAEGLAMTYGCFDDIFKKSIEYKFENEFNYKCETFIKENSWRNFGKEIILEVNNLATKVFFK